MFVKEKYYRGPQDRKRFSFIHHTVTVRTDDKCTAVRKSIASFRNFFTWLKENNHNKNKTVILKLADTLKKEYSGTFTSVARCQ